MLGCTSWCRTGLESCAWIFCFAFGIKNGQSKWTEPRNTPCNHLSKWLQPTLQPPRPSCIRHASGRHFDRKSIAQSPHTKFFRDPSPKITNIPNAHLNFLCGNPCRTNILDRSLQIYPRWLSMHQGCLEDICSNKKEWMTALISEHLVCKICVWSREILQSSHILCPHGDSYDKKTWSPRWSIWMGFQQTSHKHGTIMQVKTENLKGTNKSKHVKTAKVNPCLTPIDRFGTKSLPVSSLLAFLSEILIH